jgi:hypothetical protein
MSEQKKKTTQPEYKFILPIAENVKLELKKAIPISHTREIYNEFMKSGLKRAEVPLPKEAKSYRSLLIGLGRVISVEKEKDLNLDVEVHSTIDNKVILMHKSTGA